MPIPSGPAPAPAAHIKRRGSALHPVYALLKDKFLAAGESIKQVHRTRGAMPYTLYYATNRETEDIRQLATVSWEDSGAKVKFKDSIAEPCVPEEVQAEMRALTGTPLQ